LPLGLIGGWTRACHHSSMTEDIFTAVDQDQWAAADWPLGAHPGTDGTTFAVHAPAATRVQLEFYPSALGEGAAATYLPAKGEDGVWRAKLNGVLLGTL